MKADLWIECLLCKDKCCKWSVACPLFVTPIEISKIRKIETDSFNKNPPCVFLNQEGLCDIHNIRPTDCRFFPFDVMKISDKFFWVIWEINCPILKQKNFEPYLKHFEADLIPSFKEYLEDYSKFRLEEFLNKYRFEVIREINLNSSTQL